MSPEVFGVAEEDSWVTVVDAFRSKRVRRLPVLRGGKLVGIVTRHDLMHAIQDVRRQVRQALKQRGRPTPGRRASAGTAPAGTA